MWRNWEEFDSLDQAESAIFAKKRLHSSLETMQFSPEKWL